MKGTRRPCLNQAIQVFDRIHLSDALMRLYGLLVYSSKINKSFFLSEGQNSSITELLRIMKNPVTSSRYSKRRRLTMLLHALVSLVAFTYLHKKYITEIQRRNCCSMCILYQNVPKTTARCRPYLQCIVLRHFLRFALITSKLALVAKLEKPEKFRRTHSWKKL